MPAPAAAASMFAPASTMKSLTPLVIPGHARARLVAGSEIAPRLVLRPLVHDPSNVGDALALRGHAGRRHVVALRRFSPRPARRRTAPRARVPRHRRRRRAARSAARRPAGTQPRVHLDFSGPTRRACPEFRPVTLALRFDATYFIQRPRAAARRRRSPRRRSAAAARPSALRARPPTARA